MRFIRRHWYTLGLPIAIAAVMWALVSDLTRVQWILLLNFVVLLLHQFEEYAWPGGEPWITNEVMQPKGSRPDRHPEQNYLSRTRGEAVKDDLASLVAFGDLHCATLASRIVAAQQWGRDISTQRGTIRLTNRQKAIM